MQLLCSSAEYGDVGWAVGAASVCSTHVGGDEHLVCSCAKVDMVAAMEFRLQLRTTLHWPDDWAATMATCLAEQPGWLLPPTWRGPCQIRAWVTRAVHSTAATQTKGLRTPALAVS